MKALLQDLDNLVACLENTIVQHSLVSYKHIRLNAHTQQIFFVAPLGSLRYVVHNEQHHLASLAQAWLPSKSAVSGRCRSKAYILSRPHSSLRVLKRHYTDCCSVRCTKADVGSRKRLVVADIVVVFAVDRTSSVDACRTLSCLGVLLQRGCRTSDLFQRDPLCFA